MQCPVDNTTLAMTDRSGIEIDYCPTCRGIWLDRGELDKIIERTDAQASSGESYEHSDHQDENHRQQKKKKKGSLIGDILGGFGG